MCKPIRFEWKRLYTETFRCWRSIIVREVRWKFWLLLYFKCPVNFLALSGMRSWFKFDMLGEVLELSHSLWDCVEIAELVCVIGSMGLGSHVPGQAVEVFPGTAADCWMHTAFLLSVSVVARSPLATGQRGPAGRPAGRQLPVTDRTINKPDLSVQTPLRLCSEGPGTEPNSYTDQTTGLRSPARKIIFFCSSQRSERFMGAKCNRGFFNRGVNATVHMSLVPKLRIHGALPPLPHTVTGYVCDETRVTLLL
jgi:hypothetical protein